MTTRGKEYLILTFLFVLFGFGTESRYCGRSCETRGKTFQYAGHWRAKCDTHSNAVESNPVCTTHENATALSNMKIVTYGSRSTDLPSNILCQGPDPHFTRCSWGSRKRCRWRTPLVCREIGAKSLTIGCPPTQIVNASSNNAKAVVTWTPILCFDNAKGNVSSNCTHSSGTEFKIGSTTVQCNCTDISGNTEQCSFLIVVKDVTSPTVVCPPVQSVNANEDNNKTAEVAWDSVSCSDNSGMNISAECTPQSGTKFGLGNETVHCNCTDRSENTGHCSFLVMVKDVTSPTAVCPPMQSVNANEDNNKTAKVPWDSVSCFDNSEMNISAECTHQSGSKFGLGNETVHCNCTDRSENTGHCSFLVIVKDATSPRANCPADQIANASLENSKTVVKWNTSLCSDNSDGNISWECSHRPGDKFSIGNTTVQCNCTDESGNSDYCSFRIMVNDVTSPIADCPDNRLEKANYENNTKANVTWGLVVCSDNSNVTISPNCTHQSGDAFELGNTTVHCNCTDRSGNTDQCSFRIMIKVPTAFCPDDQSQKADRENDTKALVEWKMPYCVGTPSENVSSVCSPKPRDTFDLGETTVKCNCTKRSKYADDCSFTVTVKDETSPRAECPLDQIENANHDNNTKAVVRWQLAPCSDNSKESILLDCSHQSGHTFGLGNTTVQCNCTDASGNTGQCSFHVMVKDGIGPAADCPSDQTVKANQSEDTTAAVHWKRVSCTDNSNGKTTLNCTHQSGDQFYLGYTKVKCTCIDSSGNMGHCSFGIFVKDGTNPKANCSTDHIVNANQYNNTKAVVTWDPPSCSDNSKGNISWNCSHEPEGEFDLGNTSVQCDCTDESGNMDQCSFLIIVKDVTRPTAHCPTNQMVNATLDGNKKATVTWNPVRCSDDNTKMNISLNCTYWPGTNFSIGNTTNQCSCRDRSGNTGQCFFYIVVKDVTSPRADCPDDQTVNADQVDNTKAVVIWHPPSCSDNSEETITPGCSYQSESYIGIGNTTIECNCTDRSGNSDQCFFHITVKDVTEPIVNCPTTQRVNANLHNDTYAVATWSPTTCSDNSGIKLSANCTHHPGAEYRLGITMVQCWCTDRSGNNGQCSFNIEVRDITSPTAICPADQTHYVSENENPEAVVEWNQGGTKCTDNSPEAVYPRCSHNSGDTFARGNTRVTCNCVDVSGNSGQCSFSIVVIVVKDPKLHESFMTKNFFEMNFGKNFSLTCTADHAKEFLWKQETFNGTQYVSNSSTIQIPVSFSNQGNYFCIAKGRARSVTSQAQVLSVKNFLQFIVKVYADTTFLENVSTKIDKTLRDEKFEVISSGTREWGILKSIFMNTTNETNETKASTVYELILEKMNSLRNKSKTWHYEIINTAYCSGGTITTTDGDLSFPDALVGKSVNSSEISLTSRVAARATRSCDGDFIHEAVWKEPVITSVAKDIEENITTSIKNLAKNLVEQSVSASNASYLGDVLENVTASEDIETEHMDTVAFALHILVDARNVSEKVTTDVVSIIANVVKSTSSNKSEVSLNSNTSAAFLGTLQQQLDNVRDSGVSFNFTTPYLAVRVAQVPKDKLAIYKLPFGVEMGIEQKVTGSIWNDILEYASKRSTGIGDPNHSQDDRASIQVDPFAITERARQLTNASGSGLVPVSFTTHLGTTLFPERRKDGMKVNTLVISASVQGTVNGLPDESNIVTHFHPIQKRRCAKISCVYWDEFEGTGGWSRNGCSSTQSRHIESSYTCHCNHLTNFAVLLVRREQNNTIVSSAFM
ncbi:Hyalin [Holothuria leucospilota]|uniref:Hyalin n=1 Tax=Holothuria leucospilota TaxID=206669 RepID=A0A9Q1C1B6_HOLLE|nr:Hyalin [Holothuria leucospilota]